MWRSTSIHIFCITLLCSSLRLFGASGVVDPRFTDRSDRPYLGDEVRKVIALPDGRIIVTGQSGSPVRLNFDGSLDSTFQLSVGQFDREEEMAVMGNQFYISLLHFDFAASKYSRIISRRFSDGSIDSSFTPVTVPSNDNYNEMVNCIAPTLDGGCIISGTFRATSVGLVTNVARFKSNGALDAVFSKNCVQPFLSNECAAICSLANGQFILSAAKSFSSPNGFADSWCALTRLNSDGTTDPAF